MKNKLLALAGILSVTAYGCGSTSATVTSGGSSTALTSVGDLPAATSPVEDGSGVSALTLKSLATTGLSLGTTDSSSFASGKSLASCEMFNMTKHALSSAVQGDLIQCYITTMIDAFDQDGLDDGDYHIYSLSFGGQQQEEGGGGPPDKIKFKIAKDDAGVITEFEMYACKDGAQEMYLRQAVDGDDATMSSKNIRSGDITFAHSVSVEGKLGEDGSFVDEVDGVPTPKSINLAFTNSAGDSHNFYGIMNFNQFSDHANLTGYMSGSHTFDIGDTTEECTFSNNVYGEMQLLDANVAGEAYDIGLMALGDGALTGATVGGCGGNSWEDTFTEAWLGDDASILDPASDSDFFEDVSGHELVEQVSPTIVFASDEVYDGCGDDSDVEGTITMSELGVNVNESCSAPQLDHSHIECWQIVEEGEGGGNE